MEDAALMNEPLFHIMNLLEQARTVDDAVRELYAVDAEEAELMDNIEYSVVRQTAWGHSHDIGCVLVKQKRGIWSTLKRKVLNWLP